VTTGAEHETRLVRLAAGRWGVFILAVFALLEATIVPAPTEAMLIALILANPRRAGLLAAVATGASVTGGLIGYGLGSAFFATLVEPLLDSYGLLSRLDFVKRVYLENYMLALLTSGYTPVPYMLYTAMAGAAALPLPGFIAGSLIGRALKYLPIALLARLFGPAVRQILGRYGWIPVAAVFGAGTLLYFLMR